MSKNTQYIFKKINKIPVRTWESLAINDISFSTEIEASNLRLPVVVDCPEGVTIEEKSILNLQNEKLDPTTFEVKDVKDFVLKNQNFGWNINIKKNVKLEKPIYIDVELDDAHINVFENTDITVESGAKATIIFRYMSQANQPVLYVGHVNSHIKEDAELFVVRIQTVNLQDTFVELLPAKVEENADFQTFIALCGAQTSISGSEIDLEGDQAHASLLSLYIGNEKRLIDMNYCINFRAPETTGEIIARGTLLDHCKKIFKGTLDFHRGAVRAQGSEEESVILLSETVRNLSIPLLLCGEDDVQGAHAASTGRISEAVMFYLMSRGISEELAEKIIIEGTFVELLDNITDDSIKEEILAIVRRQLKL